MAHKPVANVDVSSICMAVPLKLQVGYLHNQPQANKLVLVQMR